MKIQMLLLDLDGKLLPMQQDIFVKAYFNAIAEKVQPHGYEPNALIETVWVGTAERIKNDGSLTNENAFGQSFAKTYGERALNDIPLFDEFYINDFDKLQRMCGYQPKSAKLISHIKDKGLRIGLATNPIFPKAATYSRISLAELKPEDFELKALQAKH